MSGERITEQGPVPAGVKIARDDDSAAECLVPTRGGMFASNSERFESSNIMRQQLAHHSSPPSSHLVGEQQERERRQVAYRNRLRNLAKQQAALLSASGSMLPEGASPRSARRRVIPQEKPRDLSLQAQRQAEADRFHAEKQPNLSRNRELLEANMKYAEQEQERFQVCAHLDLQAKARRLKAHDAFVKQSNLSQERYDDKAVAGSARQQKRHAAYVNAEANHRAGPEGAIMGSVSKFKTDHLYAMLPPDLSSCLSIHK